MTSIMAITWSWTKARWTVIDWSSLRENPILTSIYSIVSTVPLKK
jgi:hypothetical protein